jgi:hypothetical protein
VKNTNEESTNTFLSSSLQKSPSTDSSSKEDAKEIINQTISTIVREQESNAIQRNQEPTPDLSDRQKAQTPTSPPSSLNPDAVPFFARSSSKIESTHSTSTGNESDDENESNETPITSGK